MTFISENDLEPLLVESATHEAARPQFYRELVACALFVVGDITGGDIPQNEQAVTRADAPNQRERIQCPAYS